MAYFCVFWFLGSYYITITPIKYILYPWGLLNSLVVTQPRGPRIRGMLAHAGPFFYKLGVLFGGAVLGL